MLTIPDIGSITSTNGYDAQACEDSTDIAALSAALTGIGVMSGCAVKATTPASMEVAVSIGDVAMNGTAFAVPLALAAVAMASSHDRRDIVVADPLGGTPTLLGSATTTLASPYSVAVSGTRAFMVSYTNTKLVVFTVAGDTPTLLGSATTTLDSPRSVAVSGTRAFVVNYSNTKLVVFTVAGGTPTLLGSATTTLDSPYSVAVSGTRAFVANYSNTKLVVFTVAGDTPTLLGSATTTLDSPRSVAVSGTRAFVASYTNTKLVVFTVAGDTPTLLGSATTTLDHPYSVAVSGTRAFVVNYTNSKLVVFTVAGDTPTLLGSATTTLDHPYSVAVSGTRAFVASYTNTKLVVFTVAGDTPTLLGSATTTLDHPYSVAVSGTRAFVASYTNTKLVVFTMLVTGYRAKVIEGTPCTVAGWTRNTTTHLPPVKPAIPDTAVLLAEVYVPGSAASVDAKNLVDKRCAVVPSSVMGATLASNLTLTADTTTTLFTLTVTKGTWEISVSAQTESVTNPTATVVYAKAGTATGTFLGPTAAQPKSYESATSQRQSHQFTTIFQCTATETGTVLIVARASTASIAYATTTPTGYGKPTGYVAHRIA